MKKLLFTLTALLALNFSADAAFFCSKCDAEMEAGAGHECPDCDEYVCDDCWCDECQTICVPCHFENYYWCNICGECMIEHNVHECWWCNENVCDACLCVECELYCLDCMEEFRCEDCGGCAIAEGEAANCDICDALLCTSCQYGCIMCDGTFCIDDICPECTAICMNCNPNCVDCEACCGDDPITCATCGEYVCENCVTECANCGSMFCSNCIQADCGYDCGVCPDCHEDDEGYCESCGECLFAKVRCEDEYDDGHSYACAECHGEFVCPGGCNRCFAEDEGSLCSACGFCDDCALDNELHCPECEACYEDVGRCDDDGEHCRECCENNEWICEFCGHCVEAMGQDRCSECGACEDCISDYALHCANCGDCLYDEYPDESSRPEYCESCQPTDNGIECHLCDEMLEENGCIYNANGWHCAIHCEPCPFCYEVCFAENTDGACPDCGACYACISGHNLHCAECGICLYAEYPDDNTRPELCYDCAIANYGWPCNICGNLISENECLYGTEGFHCEYHCEACPTCHTVCLAETPACELCGRCTVCCSGHESEEGGTAINEENFPDDDLRDYLTNLDPIADGNIYQGELGDTLDLTNFNGSNYDWIEELCPDLHRLRCISAEQLNALSAEQKVQLTALYCPNISITTLNLSEFPNIEELDCSRNNITVLNTDQCPNLRTLICNNNQLTALNLSGNTQLTNLNCSSNKFNTLDVSDCANLQNLVCYRENGYTYLTTLNISGCINLQALNCKDNFLSQLNISGCTNLETLNCTNNVLSQLNVSNCTKLQTLYCGSNSSLSNLNLDNCTQLTTLNCYGDKITVLNLRGFTNLQTLQCAHTNKLTSLNLSGCANLETLDCSDCELLTTLNLNGCENLTSFDASGNYSLAELDLGGCRNLKNLSVGGLGTVLPDLSDCENLEEIELIGCESLETADICGLKKLKRFYIEGSYNFTTLLANDNPALEYVYIDGSDYLSLFDLNGCRKLKYLYVYAGCPYTIDLNGCSNIEDLTVGGTVLDWQLLNKFKKLNHIDVVVNEMPCSFTFKNLIGIDDSDVTGVSGATKPAHKNYYAVDPNSEIIEFTYKNETSYIGFKNRRHSKISEQSFSNYTAATNSTNGSYEHTYKCESCGTHTETISFTKQDGVFLDVCGMKGDMTWVQQFTDLKGYRCNKYAHMVLTTTQQQQLTELYVSGTAYPYENCPNLRTLSFSNYTTFSSEEGIEVDVSRYGQLENLYIFNNYGVWFKNMEWAEQLKNICIKGNAVPMYLDLDNSRELEHIETDAKEVNLSKCNNLRYVEATFGTVKFPESAPIDTVILHKALPCMPNPAAVDDFTYFDPNIDMGNVYNVKGAEYNSEDQKWNVSASALIYYYNLNGSQTKHYIGFDYTHELGDVNKKSYKITKAKLWTEDEGVAGMDYGSYLCQYDCGRCGKTIKENNKILDGECGIILDVTNWTQSDWNQNKEEWIEKYRTFIFGVKYNANSQWVMELKYPLHEIHIPNAGLSSLGGNYNFNDFRALEVLDCPGNNFTTADLSGLRYLTYVDFSNNKLTSLQFGSGNKRTENLRYLDCSGNANLNSIQNPYFNNLETFVCDNTSFSSVPLNNATKLKYFSAEQTKLTSLDVTRCTKLEHLNCYCDNGLLTDLDLSNNTKLTFLDFGGNEGLSNKVDISNLRSNRLEHIGCALVKYDEIGLDLSSMHNLRYFNCADCNLPELDMSYNTKLQTLDCRNNQLTELDLSSNTKLGKLDCSGNQLTELDLENNPMLITLYCNYNQLAELDLNDLKKLRQLDCDYNQLTTLKMYDGASNLYDINCSSNQLTDLDISKYKGLMPGSSIDISGNNLLYFDASKIANTHSSADFVNQIRQFESLPCTFRFANLAAGMKDSCVYDYVGIEPYIDGKTTMWHITAADGKITYYYNNGSTNVPNVQHTITFGEMTHKYTASKRYYTDTIPATYDAAGSCIMHTPCAYCSEEITETIVFDKLLCNVTVKDAREPGCAVALGINGEAVALSTYDGYNAKGGLINLKLNKGTELQLKAVAATGYHFVRWSDGNTDNSRTVILNDELLASSNLSFTAVFEQNSENQGGENGGENQGGNNGGENQGGNNGGNNGGENQGGNNGGENNGGENNNPGTDVDETIAQAVKVYATGLTIHVENAVGDIMLFDANGRAISRTTAADGEPVELQAPQMGVYIVRTVAGGVKVICNNY